jgi:uncharacterized protein YegL
VFAVKAHKLDKTAAAMRLHYDCPVEDRKLTCEPLFDSSKQPASAFHFVFCLDSSGSMSGTPWQQLMAAYQQLLHRRNSDQCNGDVVSVITFNSCPTVQINCAPVATAPTYFSGGSGGTAFSPALQQCDSLLAATPAGFTPILIFMSDGQDGSGNAVQQMQSLYSRYSSRNLQVHTIAFGAAAHSGYSSYTVGSSLLQSMAQAASGQYHTAVGGVQLSQVFVQIAAECGAVDGLVKRFSEILSDMITVKVMVDYL